MGKKDKGEKKKKQKKYTCPVSVDDRVKSITQIKLPELDKNWLRENENTVERWRPVYRNDWSSIREKRRLKKRHNRPKQPKKRLF